MSMGPPCCVRCRRRATRLQLVKIIICHLYFHVTVSLPLYACGQQQSAVATTFKPTPLPLLLSIFSPPTSI